jgi:hypothetical protein
MLAYSSLAPDPTSGVSRGLCKLDLYYGLFHIIDLDTDCDCGFFRLPNLDTPILTTDFAFEMGLTAGATSQQEMFTPPRHLIPPLVCPEVRVCPVLGFLFLTGFMRLITVRYLCYFM